MFALDLFNNDHERRLAEGAVDQLEQRRIDDLAMKMDDLVARAKDPAYKKNPAALAALMKEFQKCKAERDSYYKVRNETMGYGGLTGESQVTPTTTGIRHHAKPENYGGYEPEADPLARLDKHAVNRADKALGVKFNREKKYQGGLDVDEAGIPGNVPTEKIPGKEDLLKGKGRSYYEGDEGEWSKEGNWTKTPKNKVGRPVDPRGKVAHLSDVARREAERKAQAQKKNPKEVNEHGGGIGPKQHWQDLMQENKLSVGDPIIVTAPNEFEGKTGEIYDFSPSGTFVIVDLYNHGKHSMHLSDVEYNQYADDQEQDDWYDEGVAEGWSDAMVARRTGQPRTPYSVYINGKKWKDFENDDHAEAVANKLRAKFKAEGRDPSVITIAPTDIPEGVGEAIVASGPSKPLDDRAVRKLVWDTMKINADTGDQAIQRALSVLAKKPQSRMVQDLQDKFQNLADRLSQGLAEGVMSNLHADLADVYNRMAPGIERNRDSFKAGQLYDALEAVAEQHGAEAEFKRMMNSARNRAYMDYDTNPGGFHNWFWYLPFADEDVAEGLMKEPTNRKEYLDQRDKLFRMMAVDSNPANKQIIKQALQDLEARYGNLKNAVKEESSTDSEAVERAILNRIMVAHTDLLMKFGPEKVMQAAEEVAYNVGDVDEIGTSDVSAYVHQVKQILGVPEEVNEKWSQKYKSSINCANPKGFSQKAHCAGRKK